MILFFIVIFHKNTEKKIIRKEMDRYTEIDYTVYINIWNVMRNLKQTSDSRVNSDAP